jgi:hypothetical protein
MRADLPHRQVKPMPLFISSNYRYGSLPKSSSVTFKEEATPAFYSRPRAQVFGAPPQRRLV